MNASEFLFKRDEAYFSKITFFSKLEEYEEVVPARPKGVLLPMGGSRRTNSKNLMKKLLSFPHLLDLRSN